MTTISITLSLVYALAALAIAWDLRQSQQPPPEPTTMTDTPMQQLARALHNRGVEITPDDLLFWLADSLSRQTGECSAETFDRYVSACLTREKPLRYLAIAIRGEREERDADPFEWLPGKRKTIGAYFPKSRG